MRDMRMTIGERIRWALGIQNESDRLAGLLRYAKARVSLCPAGAAIALRMSRIEASILIKQLEFYGCLRMASDRWWSVSNIGYQVTETAR